MRASLHPVASLARDSENLFLELGKILPELARAGDHLHAGSRNMAEHLKEDGLAARQFSDTRARLLAVLHTQQEASEAETSLVESISDSQQQLRQMRETEARLRELMVLLRVIQILFRTESAALDDNVRAFFWGLSDNIQTLETRMKQTFEERFEKVGAAAAGFTQVIAQTQQQAQQRALQAAAMNASLDRSLARMESQLAENAAREHEASAVSARIAELGSQLIVALQTHDIVSQKLQHLIEGVELAAASSNPGALRDFVAIAAAQIAAVNEELEQVERLVRQSAAEIAGASGSNLEGCVIVSGFEAAHASAGDLMAQLAATREQTLDFLRLAEQDTSQTLATVKPLEAAISGLNQVMSAISRQIGMVALNAQIMAVHNGEGTALELLAARATEISRLTEELGVSLAETSAAIAGSVHTAAAQLSLIDERFRSGRLTLEQDEAAHRTLVADSSGQRDQWLRDLGAAVEHIRSLSGCALDQVDRFAAPRRSLASVEEGLRALLAQLQPAGAAPVAACQQTLTALEQRYTMASERSIHHQALRGSGDSPSPPAAPAPAAAEDLQPGDIELF
ncbi:MAG: hypothetical protein JNK87_05255 [Bryobacterales bacterium]|nr:hypothetical protein [Bryobacterales bacterium]